MVDVVLQDLNEGLLTITLNRPERRNAMNGELTHALLAAAERAAMDRDVRAVLLKGAGGTFCVGGDLNSMENINRDTPTFEYVSSETNRLGQSSYLFHAMNKPVVAAVEGAAAGAGLSLALSADLRVVGETTKLTTSFAKVGLSGDWGGTYFLTKLIGSAKARELFMLSPILNGVEATALGMATKCVPDAEVVEVATELATQLARGPTVAFGYIKKNINSAESFPVQQCLHDEAMFYARCAETADHKEATTAFVQKRPPQFTGR